MPTLNLPFQVRHCAVQHQTCDLLWMHSNQDYTLPQLQFFNRHSLKTPLVLFGPMIRFCFSSNPIETQLHKYTEPNKEKQLHDYEWNAGCKRVLEQMVKTLSHGGDSWTGDLLLVKPAVRRFIRVDIWGWVRKWAVTHFNSSILEKLSYISGYLWHGNSVEPNSGKYYDNTIICKI